MTPKPQSAVPKPTLLAMFEDVLANTNKAERRERDPVRFVHLQENAADQELVGLLAAQLAFGQVTTILAKVSEVLERLALHGKTPTQALDVLLSRPTTGATDPLDTLFSGFRHRVFVGADVAALLRGGRAMQVQRGSLEAGFLSAWGRADGPQRMATALGYFCDELRHEGRFPRRGDPSRRGATLLLPDVGSGSGAKRLCLFLRWMVRPADGIDVGLWDFETKHLLIPLDTHIHKIARNLGMTSRTDASIRTANEVTAALRKLDANDPIRFDFAICHLMMNQHCKEHYVAEICGDCPLGRGCRHTSLTNKATSHDPHA